MQIITYMIIGILGVLGTYFLFGKDKNPITLIKSFLGFTILLNIVILGICRYIFGYKIILEPSLYTSTFLFMYIVTGVVCLGIYFTLKAIFTSKIQFNNSNIIFTKEEGKFNKKSFSIKTLSFILFALGIICLIFSYWFISYFGKITPEQFLFNLKSPLSGTSNDSLVEIVNTPVFGIIFACVIFLILMNFPYRVSINKGEGINNIITKKIVGRTSLILSVLIFFGGASYCISQLKLHKVAMAYLSDSSFIADNYRDPRNIPMSFPKKKRNLIHIYLESVENSFLSKDLGGNMDVNLMPELTELSKEGISFSHNDKFGGPYQTYGSSWSVASMMNMGVGIPLKVPMKNNSYGLNGSFLPGAIAIGDILETQGYNQTIMFGADADFGGLTTFFTSHGGFNIFDYKAAKRKGLIPKDYYVWWGYEDDKLFNYAKMELTRLYKEGKPFNFTMETADTHFPDGYLSKKAEKKHSSQYANVISYSDKEAVNFVRWIQKQPFYENTTIVITGDHLSMDKNFFKEFDPNYHRTVFNLILNSPVTTDNTKNRQYAPFDFFPTILSSMGVEIQGDRLGLGTNLFSKTPTLIEKDGLEKVESELGRNSNFFNDEFINEKKTSVFSPDKVTER
ncbi:LTA synthase family protein [Clostridium sp.]|uniref:LTA synthase family protein n=1 Tax=Clostridium sp. TaxID=1506 RepID=UPI002FC7D75C